jgi:hypothetical protein
METIPISECFQKLYKFEYHCYFDVKQAHTISHILFRRPGVHGNDKFTTSTLANVKETAKNTVVLQKLVQHLLQYSLVNIT